MNAEPSPTAAAGAAPQDVRGGDERFTVGERAARLRRMEAELASLPTTALDADDERERDRLHAWSLAQQRFFVDLQAALSARGAQSDRDGNALLLPEERHLLRELDRFADQTQACIVQGRLRAHL